MLKSFLLSKKIDCGLLVIRAFMGADMLFSHGLSKLTAYDKMLHSFPDPIGLGHEASYILTVVAEFFCSGLLLLGLFTRVALIPLIINMAVIIFVVQMDAPWAKKESAWLFLIPYLTIFLTGPGKYSLDYLLFERNKTDKA